MENSEKNSFRRSIGGKLIIIFTLVILSALGVLTIVAITQMSKSLTTEATAKLEAVQSEKSVQLHDLFINAQRDSEVISRTTSVKDAVSDLIVYHNEMNITDTGEYDITGNSTELSKTYEDLYSEINKRLRIYNDVYGYFDVFIMCAKHGHVMYTNAAEADLGTNLSVGEYSDSGLGLLWKKVMEDRKTSLVDLAP